MPSILKSDNDRQDQIYACFCIVLMFKKSHHVTYLSPKAMGLRLCTEPESVELGFSKFFSNMYILKSNLNLV